MLEEMEVKIKDKETGEVLVIVFEAGFVIRKKEEETKQKIQIKIDGHQGFCRGVVPTGPSPYGIFI